MGWFFYLLFLICSFSFFFLRVLLFFFVCDYFLWAFLLVWFFFFLLKTQMGMRDSLHSPVLIPCLLVELCGKKKKQTQKHKKNKNLKNNPRSNFRTTKQKDTWNILDPKKISPVFFFFFLLAFNFAVPYHYLLLTSTKLYY